MKRERIAAWLVLVVSIALGSSLARAGQNDKPKLPTRPWTVFLLPHSHNDIGYTHPQPEVERKQWQNIDRALELCRQSANNPPGARFKWNAEVLWAVESYLREAPPEKQRRLVEAIRAGQFELDALYGNELTGLCRPEELLRLCQCSQRLARRCGVKIDTAMITDVPGYTWGLVPVLGQAGVNYLSAGVNAGDRIGRTLSTWCEKPFYWISPDGRHRVLCWVPYGGYSLMFDKPLVPTLTDHLVQLEREGYPFDMIQMRWCKGGDNGPPDATLADAVKKWNAEHATPRFVIATTSEAFHAFEKKYGDRLPNYRGDWTPYWEDGAASSARETAMNRNAAERLVQAETLWSMLDPRWYPVERFDAAWRNAILYDEHTWGAWNSIGDPDATFVHSQWKYKREFAQNADSQSRELLTAALAGNAAEKPVLGVDVFNTSSWPRTDLVVLSTDQASGGAWSRENPNAHGDVVLGPEGKPVPSQRLSTGELAFLAKDMPPLAGRRYTIVAGKAAADGRAKADAASLTCPGVTIALDPASGVLTSLRAADVDAELCDAKSGVAINRYAYVVRDKIKEPLSSGKVKIAVKERGPLVASLAVESDAPGCARLTREYRVVDGLDRVEIVNTLDKLPVREKEGVHLGFAFHVPDGVMHIDVPWAVVRPEADQIPGACKNWFTVGRWVDVSNRDYGVTWATLDAPMLEVGGITAGMMDAGRDPRQWIEKLAPTQTFYSFVMNNHWYTNYKADQAGPTTFRYALLPHKQYDAAAAARFGIERSQPLVVAPARGVVPTGKPFLELDTPDVFVASIKPSADRAAWIVRLFGAAGRSANVGLRWAVEPRAVSLSDLSETPGRAVAGKIAVPAWGLVTLRVDMPKP